MPLRTLNQTTAQISESALVLLGYLSSESSAGGGEGGGGRGGGFCSLKLSRDSNFGNKWWTTKSTYGWTRRRSRRRISRGSLGIEGVSVSCLSAGSDIVVPACRRS